MPRCMTSLRENKSAGVSKQCKLGQGAAGSGRGGRVGHVENLRSQASHSVFRADEREINITGER